MYLLSTLVKMKYLQVAGPPYSLVVMGTCSSSRVTAHLENDNINISNFQILDRIAEVIVLAFFIIVILIFPLWLIGYAFCCSNVADLMIFLPPYFIFLIISQLFREISARVSNKKVADRAGTNHVSFYHTPC